MREHILFSLACAPGDSLVLTGAIRDFVKEYGTQFDVSVQTHGQEVWENNPYVVPAVGCSREIPLKLVKPTMSRHELRRANLQDPRHFIQAYHNVISQELALPLFPLTKPTPDLFLTDKDVAPALPHPYWVIFPGWKHDIPLKGWNPQYWQELVDILGGWGIKCVQVGRANLYTPQLVSVTNLNGKTSLRQLYALINNAEGVICGVSQGMHIAAALDKPCVVLGGGREAWWWEAYSNENPCFPMKNAIKVPHRYLHTLGLLDCCKEAGCWKTHPTQMRSDVDPGNLCTCPVSRYGFIGGRCMDMITPRHVIDAVLSYYIDKTLAPISQELESLVNMLPNNLGNISQPLTIQRPDGIKLILTTENEIPIPPAETVVTNTIEIKPPIVQRGGDIPELNHPVMGGYVTLCVLLYGNYDELHKRCLASILATTNNRQVEIRVGGNQLCHTTVTYLNQLKALNEIQHLDLADENRKKYPVMRKLFRDPELTTNWVIWFDDDTMCNKDDRWLGKMAQVAIDNYASGCRVIGPSYRYTAWSPQWEQFCKSAPWYSGREWPVSDGKIKPGFLTGSFWMGHVPTIIDLDIPDPRIGHNKGDVTVGCQFYQGGWTLCGFSTNRDVVNWSSVPRRGITDIHPAEI